MEKQKHFFSRENRTSLLIALILTILNIAIVFCFDLQKLSFESRRLTAFQIISSAAFYILYIVFCIFMRIRRYTTLAKALFYYQLVGAAAYILYFFCFLFRTGLGEAFYTLFNTWTLLFQPIMVALGRLSGIQAKYLSALFYLVLTLITGKTVIAIRKDIAYEKQYREDHMHEKTEE